MTEKRDYIVLNSLSTTPASVAGTLYYDDGTNGSFSEPKLRFYKSSFLDIANEVEIAIFDEEQAATTAGGSYTANTDTTRTLNTTVQSQSWASLSSNRITIDGSTYPGTYEITWNTPGYRLGRMYSWLVQDPAGTPADAAYGTASYNTLCQQSSFGKYTVTLSASQTYEIRIRGNASQATTGLGNAHSITGMNNVYTQVVIKRFF